MIWAEACAAVIPCLNEAAAIGPLVRNVRAILPMVFVVDDGSSDGTVEAARAAGARVLEQGSTQGKGAALRAGWKAAREAGFAWALCLDGDGQHLPGEATEFFKSAEATGADLVMGNRMARRLAMPWLRFAVNRWMSRRLSRLAGQSLPDTQCGYRLVRLAMLDRIVVRSAHYEIESELLMETIRVGGRVAFVPITTVYRGETSHIQPWRDTLRWLAWWKRERAGKKPVA